MSMLVKYDSLLSAIAAAIQMQKNASSEASSVNKTNADSVTEKVRQYAVESAENGDDVAQCRRALQLALAEAEVKSVASYGNSFAGYRAMIADNEPVETVNMKDAQTYIASDEVKAKTAARKDLLKAIKYANSAELLELIELAKADIPQDAKARKAKDAAAKATATGTVEAAPLENVA